MSQVEFDALLPPEMAQKAEDVGVGKATKHPRVTLMLAIMAGAFIGIAFVFYAVVTTGNTNMGWGANKMLGGLAFSLGLMLVVVNGGELFTSTVLTVVAKASKKISWGQLARNWLLVYFGNFIGALLLVGIMLLAKHYDQANGSLGISYMSIAQHKLHHTFLQAVALGTMCNVMVCLGVWMTFSARTLTDKLLAVVLPVAMFVAAGFEHCVANMFMIPMGILTKASVGPEFWQATGRTAAEFADLTWTHFFINNLLPVTIGNIIGGGFLVGLCYWFIYLRPSKNR
ncbi:formate transporter FocA [Cohaesibacter celericrescens]|uniref:Formate transporter FocA n=1 Tax=Cohaesibacter celericrescens TaxID=2067669 RepID=A0A2N5XNQ4_9HYPH|nr:formate transporter FocA [Cohaesibacter celericrescens]PLW76134.1 formate transporter FocA [Cohaesibacter celericrescens]